jgi:hypothetical protein
METEMKVVFKFEKETKNAWRFRAADSSVIPGYNTLYIAKIEGKSAPAQIEVTISL